jgi:tetratricopeptide (TPR) repeat protein
LLVVLLRKKMASNSKTNVRRMTSAKRQTTRTGKNSVRQTDAHTIAPARLNAGLSLLLVLLTIGVYSSVGQHPFIEYDDPDYVTTNAHVKAGLTWETLTWALTSTEASNWHPLTWLSHAADCELFGLNPSGHHWTSLLIHAINVILLFFLLQQVTGTTWESAFVAALFALHPLNVESVAWIAERKNVLSTMFYLLALGAYGWYARKPEARRYVVLAVLFVLGLASKPMVITLPFVLMLLDFWPLQRIENWTKPAPAFPVERASFSRLLLEKLPLLLLSAGSAILTIVAQRESIVQTERLPLEVRLETSLYSYGVYIWKMLWPAHLALIYPHPGRTLAVWKPLLGALLILAASVWAWTQRFRRPYLAVGWLWYLGTAVPIIGIMQVGVQVVADRYAYIPLIGLFVALTWGLSSLADAAGVSMASRSVAAALVLAALALTTWRQVSVWQGTVNLWSHAVEVTSNNSLAEDYLANTLFELGRYQEGMVHLRIYASLEPLDPLAHVKVAADSEDHGQFSDAAREYEKAIKAARVLEEHGSPGMDSRMLAITYANLGVAYIQMGNAAKAADSGRQALSTDPQTVGQMVQDLSQAVAARPTAAGYVRLGMLLQLFGRVPEAQQAFTQAQRLNPAVTPQSSSGGVVKNSQGQP